MLNLNNGQLVVRKPQSAHEQEQSSGRSLGVTSIPIEDIGIVVLDHAQITMSHGLLSALIEHNVAVVSCNNKHMPVGLQLPLEGNSLQSERFACQLAASLPLKKQLWQQTVAQKIRNQAAVLKSMKGAEVGNMAVWASAVRSGDSDNMEGRAAAYYWRQMFAEWDHWTRDREGDWPNPLLNYGYAIVRAMVARALVASGLLPTLGIHHHNRYNAYCLADDIMEPYRPYVDLKVMEMMQRWGGAQELNTEMKRELLGLPVREVRMGGRRSPMLVAVSQTTASLYKCYAGESRKIVYPEITEEVWTVSANTESCG